MRVRRRHEGIRRAAKTQSPAHRRSRNGGPANPGRIRLEAWWRVESEGSPGQALNSGEPTGRPRKRSGRPHHLEEQKARGTEPRPPDLKIALPYGVVDR